MSIKRPGFQTIQDLAFTVGVRPIAAADLRFVEQAMMQIAPDLSVELHGVCADEAFLILLPEDGDDAKGPSFMISRETFGFRLDQVHWDAVADLGVFASLNDVVSVLGVRLAAFPDWATPASVTVH
jgi:hypothetical protein